MASPHPSREDPYSAHQDEIQEMVQHGFTNESIVDELARRGLQTSTASLKRRLRFWGIRRQNGVAGVRTGGITDDLAEAVNYLFHHTTLNDDQLAARIISDYHLQTTGRQVKTIRLLFGWLRRSRGAVSDAQTASTYQQVAHLLDGPGRTFGREWFMAYLRVHHGYKARRLDVSNAQKILDPEGVAQRQPGFRKPRLENYVTSGPNFLWCLDGHDKLAQYGIQIYAAVDAYSRKIIWFYCGNSNRTAISVIRQYLNTVKAIGLCPRLIRTDHGTETFLLCDIHFSLFIEAELRKGLSDEYYQSLRISDCYIYGPSTRNVRAEGLWRLQGFTTTVTWLEYFRSLQLATPPLSRQDQLADQVVFRYLFMPILRDELVSFVGTWNAHKIRAQPNRSHHVPGVPDELYRTGQQEGFVPDLEVLSALESQLLDYGNDKQRCEKI
jgi:hypothetical protein